MLFKASTFSGYKLQGRIKFQGLSISIENRKGSYREGIDPDGKKWRTFMHIPYGYIRLTEGTDGDHIDVYIGPEADAEFAYVIHQNDPISGQYDEDKVMLGFDSKEAAKKAYYKQYDKPERFFGAMSVLPMEKFKQMALKTLHSRNKILKAAALLLLAKKLPRIDKIDRLVVIKLLNRKRLLKKVSLTIK